MELIEELKRYRNLLHDAITSVQNIITKHKQIVMDAEDSLIIMKERLETVNKKIDGIINSGKE